MSMSESERAEHGNTLSEAQATVKKVRKYILLHALSPASTEQLFKVDIIYKGNRDKENLFFFFLTVHGFILKQGYSVLR